MREEIRRMLDREAALAARRAGMLRVYADGLARLGETALALEMQAIARHEQVRAGVLLRKAQGEGGAAEMLEAAAAMLFAGGVVGIERAGRQAKEQQDEDAAALCHQLAMAARLDDQRLCELLDSCRGNGRRPCALWRCMSYGSAWIGERRPMGCGLCGGEGTMRGV